MTPNLRFPEFKDEWQEKLVKDVAPLQRGFDLPASQIISGNYPVVFSNGVLKYHNEFMASAPGVITGRSGTIGKVHYVTNNYWPHNTSLWVTDFKANHPKYVYYLYSVMDLAGLSTGSGVPTLNRNDVHNKKVSLPPTISEQLKIADFLTAVDEKIDTLEKKVELLKKYKQGVMQKIFSQEIRFKDEKGDDFPDWDAATLVEVATRVTTRNRNQANNNVLTNSATQGIVSQRDYFEKDIANQGNLSNYFIVNSDDFVYNPRISVTAPVGPIKRNHLSTGVMSPLYSVFRFIKGNLNFYENYFETNLWHDYLKSVANYGARHDRMSITINDFYSMPIPLPSTAEQQKIADFLTEIDNKVNLAHKELKNAKQFKKALLQRMFA